jgi:hypothetical protein
MSIGRRRLVSGVLPAMAIAAAARPAGAVIILDSTWRAEGGRPGRESAGFRAHIALANQPQFAGLVSFSRDEEVWGSGSGTWIANVGGRGRILTAAHLFDDGASVNEYVYRTASGAVQRGVSLGVHPLYEGDINDRTGYDVAIVTLEGPVTDAGSPPVLYVGPLQVGTRIVMVGFGSRGVASVGQQPAYYEGSDKAAAENIVSDVMETVWPVPKGEDSGNWFEVTLQREGEGASRLDGILGSGDSGGSTWLNTAGRWAIVGVNSSGTGDIYGASSSFTWIAGVRGWLAATVPGTRFIG